jgi:H+/Cl- antiporter ClcA
VSCTQQSAFSTSIILLEMTGDYEFLLPVLVGSAVGMLAGSYLTGTLPSF